MNELVKAIDHEAVVRGAWKLVSLEEDYGWHFHFGDGPEDQRVYLFVEEERGRAAAWLAVYEFTVQRQEEIRQIDAEIEWVTECSIISPKMEQLYRDKAWEFSAEYLKRRETAKRVLSRLQSIRAELQRGMSAQPDVQEGRDE
jgi:hypothetical protein